MTSLGVKTLSTTAYHPQCNGLVERLHRTLKAAIRARLVDSDWQSALPLVLLGLRSAWKEGQDNSPADLVYGVPLRLPGQFIPGAELPDITPVSSFVSTFQAKMKEQRPAPSRHHAAPPSFIPPALQKCTSVFVRYDGVRRPLQNPYDGPYQVLQSGDKYFKILRQGLPYTVSVDRLKPCHSPSSLAAPSSMVPIVPFRPSHPSPPHDPGGTSSSAGRPNTTDLPMITKSGRISKPPIQ